jgi:peptidoglycan/xylan/chitin deacetylase (PgdA/CDA1 family)
VNRLPAMTLRSKKAVLTYHRIVENGSRGDGASAPSFYDLHMVDFKGQVARLADHMRRFEAGQAVPAVLPTFDDGTEDHLRAAEILAQAGISAVFFIITGRVGSAGYLSETGLRDLVRLGHRLGSHTVTHRRITTLSAEALWIELQQSRDFLEQAMRQKVEWFAPPGGYFDETSLKAALACDYRFVRTMEWGYASTNQTGRIPCIPVLPGTSDQAFEKIINGKALLFGFRLKEALKRVVGERIYVALRNRLWTGRPA